MIREEYKNAFLDERNKKVVMIRFTEDDEIIDASRIVDQGSFSYVESSNDSEKLKLGLSEASSFEIDIKGDLSDRSGAEIYVEVLAYVENENQIKAYPIPIGTFMISNVDYDYVLDKSHILCYDRIVMEKETELVDFPTSEGGSSYVLSNYYINLITNNVLPKEYYDETPPITIEKVINPNTYYENRTFYGRTDSVVSGSVIYRYYATQQVMKYQSIEYVFDVSMEISSRMFFIIKSATKLPSIVYDTVVMADGENAIRNTFWKNNADYNYDNYSYSSRNITLGYQYTRFSTSDYNLIYPDSTNVYKMSYSSFKLEDGKHAYGISFVYQYASGYRYGTYTSMTASDYRDLWNGFNENGVVWTNSRPKADASVFPDLVVSYPKVNMYMGIPLMKTNGSVNATANKYRGSSVSKILSDLAEVNGEMIKVDRISGELVNYSFLSEENIYPSDSGIYPSNDIYPNGDRNIVKISKSMYSTLISKTKQSKKIGKVVVTWNSYSSGVTSQRIAQVDDFNELEYGTLELSDKNFFIDAEFLDAQNVADKVLNMYKNYMFTPFELECTGLPWLEAGDWIIVETDDGQQRLNVNRRTLSGIQGMMDSLSAGGI